MTHAVPDGWYPDPSDPRRGRLWRDGRWTDSVVTAEGRSTTIPLPTAPGAEPGRAGGGGLLTKLSALDDAVIGDRGRRPRAKKKPMSTADKVGWFLIGGIVLVVVLSVMVGDGLPRREISRDSYGPGWTLSVDSGELVCDLENRYGEGLKAIFFDTGGTRYAVNGTARGGDHPPVDQLFLSANPRDPSEQLDVNDLVGMGVALCRGED